MSPWLKTRLLSLLCGALLVGGATYLHAQEDYGPPAKTPEEAATNFWKLLDLVREPNNASRAGRGQNAPSMDEMKTIVGSLSRAQFESLSGSGVPRSNPLELLATEAVAPTYEGRVESSSGDQTIVSVTPPTQPKAHEVVVVSEEGGYRVDMVATYARWHHLSGLDADKALFKATGWISPKLSGQPEFAGRETNSQCQSQLKQIGLAVAQYTQDYDERMPPARRWEDVLYPYARSEALYTCPVVAAKGKREGYAFNSKLSQITLATIQSAAQTVSVYETSNLNHNVFAPFTGRAYRHSSYNVGNGMNICFTDGHVKRYEAGTEQALGVAPSGANIFGVK